MHRASIATRSWLWRYRTWFLLGPLSAARLPRHCSRAEQHPPCSGLRELLCANGLDAVYKNVRCCAVYWAEQVSAAHCCKVRFQVRLGLCRVAARRCGPHLRLCRTRPLSAAPPCSASAAAPVSAGRLCLYRCHWPPPKQLVPYGARRGSRRLLRADSVISCGCWRTQHSR